MAFAVAGSACTDEATEPITPGGSPTTASTLPAHAVTPTPEVEEYARQQCLDDPSLGEGVVRIIEPETDTVVAEVVIDCDDVR